MRRFAWLCVVMGILLALAGPFWERHESARRYDAWLDQRLPAPSSVAEAERQLRLLDAQIAMLNAGRRPAWTVASPWPLVRIGATVTAFGILLLAIRRPGARK